MTNAVSAICAAILLLAAGFHFYWGFGGRVAAGVALPQREDGSPAIETAAFGAIAVGLVLAVVLLLVFALVGMIHLPLPQSWLRAGGILWAVIFTARALSWSRYVGCSSGSGRRVLPDMIHGSTARYAWCWGWVSSIWR
ncbi:DUF3995 domain-containing protein [Mesorhizobium sp. AR10]|nr:DUF3995 domain-containing protein [Mesorhizobium sp. AR10]UVK36731.1 DUF3995 domain-containing protein [Mesorhizobium sp. AR10]